MKLIYLPVLNVVTSSFLLGASMYGGHYGLAVALGTLLAVNLYLLKGRLQ